MKRLATFAAAIAVAVATPCAATELMADESSTAVMTAATAVAQARDHAEPVLAERNLRPGGYWWSANAPGSGDVETVVSLEDQMAYVYRAGQLIGVATISSGKPGKDTPAGIFPILEKKKMHRSRKYDDAPMPFMQRIDRFGIALHAGHNPGRPASHGCIRLPAAFAAKLFSITSIGDRVVIA